MSENVIENRINFAISALKIAGAIENVSRGKYSITVLGIKLFNDHGYNLTSKIVESTEPYIEYYRNKELEQNDSKNRISEIRSFDLLENIEERINQVQQERKDELLEMVLTSSPYLFEKMVVLLLSKMGYKGEQGKSFVTKKSNDGGIDGIISQDPLGTQTVYIQAKRYTKGNVQRNEIEAFFGALTSINSKSGVFITTSDFSKNALVAAKRFSIITINREELLNLLLEYEVGIEKDKTYYTYKLDQELFDENQ